MEGFVSKTTNSLPKVMLNQRITLLALSFEIVFEMSRSLALVRQPTTHGHVWRIVIGIALSRPSSRQYIINIQYMKMTNPNLSK
jgi:hypothetical protein